MSMIDLDLIAPLRLVDLQPGELFLHQTAGKFMGAWVEGSAACIALDGEDPFHVAPSEAWSRPDGFKINEARFEVDHSSACAAEDITGSLGALILAANGKFMVAGSGHERYVASLQQLDVGEYAMNPRIGFKRWRVVSGPSARGTPLFTHGDAPIDA
jgi:hypothetical protein